MKKYVIAAGLCLIAVAAYADTKISQMPSGGNLTTGDVIPILRGGSNFQATYTPSAASVASFTGDSLVYNNSLSTGAVTLSLANQSANLFFSGPATGAATTPTFRPMVTADLPVTAVTPGSYTSSNLTVDATGRITAAASGLAATSTVLGPIKVGTGLSIDGTGVLSTTSTGGGGSGTVNSGTAPQLAYYATTGTAVSGATNLAYTTTGFGIKTTTPLYDLDINDGTTGPGAIRVLGSNTIGNLGIRFEDTAAGGKTWHFSMFAGGSTFPGGMCMIDVTDNLTSWCWGQSTMTGLSNGVFGFTNQAVNNATTPDIALSRTSTGVMALGTGATGNTSGKLKASAYMSAGTKFTASGCSNASTVGGATAGQFTLGANSCSVVVTMGDTSTSSNGWACHGEDQTAPTVLITQSASSATTATLSIPGGAGTSDVIVFSCMGY